MRSILIIRLSAIGDVVMASPLVAALKRAHPQARLCWLAQPEVSDLLAANPLVDEVLLWPKAQWRQLWRERRLVRLAREILAFVRGLRRRRFEVVIDVQGLLKSGIWARLSGAPVRIGLGSKEGSAWLMTRVIDKPRNDGRIGSEYRHLAQEMGWNVQSFEMTIALTDADRRVAEALIRERTLGDGFVVLCPFTTRPQKHWPPIYWVETVGRVRDDLGLPAVILGGPGDKERGDELAGRSGAINLCGMTGLREAGALIERARLLIGVDTGLTHMGLAFGTPTIAIFGSTCPYREPGRENAVVLYDRMPCSPCRRRPICNGDFTCMSRIRPERVMREALRLAGRREPQTVG